MNTIPYGSEDAQLGARKAVGGPGRTPGFSGPEGGAGSPACRWCGRPLAEVDARCAECGHSQALLPIEVERNRRLEWMETSRTSGASGDEARKKFDELYRGAMMYLETNTRKSRTGIIGDTDAHHTRSIELVQKLIEQEPLRREGYELLARLYEGEGNLKGAAACYREIMLRHPEDQATRKKYCAVMRSAPRRPPAVVRIQGAVCFSLAWMGFWILQSAEWAPWPLLLLGFGSLGGLLFFLLMLLEKRGSGRVTVEPRIDPVAFEPVPLPERRLTWGEEARRARWLAEVIEQHTNVRVPVLSPWRFLISLSLCLLLTVVFAVVVWINRSPQVFLALPAGFFLILYGLEIQPRARVAYVLLQHFREESEAPWADPDLPFVPRGTDRKVQGEFMVDHPDEFPLRWALSPHPYGIHLHDILDSIQQTLNRHWTFHRHYEEAGVTRHYSIYFPAGRRILGLLAGGNFAMAVSLAAIVMVTGSTQEIRYRRDMGTGFVHLSSSWENFQRGNLAAASERGAEAMKQFVAAEDEFPGRALPSLFAAMSFEAQGMTMDAEAAYQRAASKPKTSRPILRVVNNEFGNFLLRQQRLDEAAALYEEAHASAPQDPDISNNLGQLHFLREDYVKAASAFRESLSSPAGHALAQTNLGRVYEFMNDAERAREYYQKAIDAYPRHHHTDYARQRMAARLDPRDLKPVVLPVRHDLVARPGQAAG